MELYRREYLTRRAYPDSALDIQKRLQAYAALQALRDSLHMPYIPPGKLTLPVVAAMPCYWTPVGPTNVPGRVTGMAVTPAATAGGEPRVIVTTVGGVWRSPDGGRRWECVSNERMKAGIFGAVAVNPTVPSEVFVAGGDPNLFWAPGPGRPGIWRSAPGGPGMWRSGSGGDPASWNRADANVFDALTVFRIVVSPNFPHPIYVATDQGVYFGDRSGIGSPITWTRLKGISPNGLNAETSDIAVDFDTVAPIDPPVVYAGVSKTVGTFGKGIWKFTGTPTSGSWVKKSGGIATQSGAITLALSPSDRKVLYARIAYQRDAITGADARLLGIYKTKTAGEPIVPGNPCNQPWCNMVLSGDNDYCDLDDSHTECDPLDCTVCDLWYTSYNGAMVVHPTDPEKVFVGGLGLWASDDGAENWWSAMTGPDPLFLNQGLHEDQHALAFDPSNPNVLWVGNDGGVWRSTDRSVYPWHWEARAHGMSTTQFYRIASQDGAVTPFLGGTQDNGTTVTHGNFTWHAEYTCDGAEVGLDAESNVTVYESCNGPLVVRKHAVQGIEGAWVNIPPTPGGPEPYAPFAVDPRRAGHVLAVGKTGSDWKVVTTSDARTWTAISNALPSDLKATCAAIAPELGIAATSAFRTFYVGLRKETQTGTAEAVIMSRLDSTTPWVGVSSNTSGSQIPALSPNAIAVDRNNRLRAFVAFGGGGGGAGEVCVTTDGGGTWTKLPGVSPNILPPTPVTGVAIDPINADRIYVSTADGVFKGDVSFGPPITARWEPFADQLPDAVDANSIAVHKPSGTLILGTFGYGAYQRVIDPATACPPVALSVRDNVFDRALWPAPVDVPDPEHPVPIGASRPEFYKADDTAAGRLWWWSSSDIRVELPSTPPREHDHVEFEECPLLISECHPDALTDVKPEQDGRYRVYVQVANRGHQAATQVRVTPLWAEATAGLPLLPADFWSTTLPTTLPAGTACGPLTPGSGWQFLNTNAPCKIIPAVSPNQPEVVWFDWHVPPAAASHSCVMAIVESAQDPIPTAMRSVLDPAVLVPQVRQIGLRNLHIVPTPMQATSTNLPLLQVAVRDSVPGLAPQELVISRAGLSPSDTLDVLLPATPGLSLGAVDSVPANMTTADRSAAFDIGVDTSVVYRVRHPEGRVRGVQVAAGLTNRVGLRFRPHAGPQPRGARRFVIMAKRDSTVLGGSTFLIRRR